MINLDFTTQIFKEGDMRAAYCPEFDISSCGYSASEAKKNLKDALAGFLESAKKRGVLTEILSEAGYEAENKTSWKAPEFLSFEKSNMLLQYA